MRTLFSSTGSVCLAAGLWLSPGCFNVRAGSALAFDGTNDYVQVGSGLFANVTNSFTIELWAYPAVARAVTAQATFGIPGVSGQRYAIYPDQGGIAYGAAAHAGAGISIGTNGVSVFEHSDGYLPSPLVFATNLTSWTHVAVVYANGIPRLYVAGSLVRTGLSTGHIVHPSANLGGTGDNLYGPFGGILDEVRIWSVALDESTLRRWRDLEMDPSHPAFTNLIGYWRLDEGSGTTTVDSSSRGHHGTLQHGPVWVTPGAPINVLSNPVVVTLPVSELTETSGRLEGSVNPRGTATAAWFEWGASTNYGFTTPPMEIGAGETVVAVSFLLTSLLPTNDYYYRLVATNTVGLSRAAGRQFRTPGMPAAATLPPTGLAPTSAGIVGQVNPNGLATASWFEWGSNTTYGNLTTLQMLGPGSTNIVVTNALTGLIPGTEYHYRIQATNSSGSVTGLDVSFRTFAFSNVFSGSGDSWYANSSVSWGDADRDGDLDLLLLAGQNTNIFTTLFRNDEASWTSLPAYYWDPNPGLPQVILGTSDWGDYDHDGDLDLLITGTDSRYYDPSDAGRIFRNDGGNLFTNAVAGLPPIGLGGGAWADYDNDGNLDFILVGADTTDFYQPQPTNLLARGDGRGGFLKVNAGLPALINSSVAWGDHNNDGQLDLLIAGGTGGGLITRVYHNSGGLFTDIGAGLPGVAFGSVAWGDYDQDGWLDILLAGTIDNSSNGAVCKIFRNAHNGTFTEIPAGLPGVFQGSASWGDYDNDGQLDILLTGVVAVDGGPAARVYRNDHGIFSDLDAGLSALTSGSGAWGDYDADGRMDLVVIGTGATGWWSGRTARIFKNYALPATTAHDPPSLPVNLQPSITNNSAVLRWDAATDPHTPAPGLTYNVRVGTTPGGGQVVPPQSDPNSGQRWLPQMGNAEHRLFSVFTNLPVGLYYWSVQTVNHSFVGSAWAAEQTFAITSGPPVVATLPASNVLCCSALVNGLVTPGGLATRAWFEWGPTTNYGNSTPPLDLVTGLIPQSVPQALSGLQPLTTYFFRLVATNSAGLALGTNQSFTTAGPAPIVATLTSSNVLYTSAALLGTSPLFSPPADYFVEWGTTPAYGQMSPAAVIDAAVYFDGVDDCVAVGWGRFPSVTNNFTIELWVNPAAGRGATVESVAGTAGAGGQRYAIFPEQGSVAYVGGHAGVGLSVGTNGVSVMEHTGAYLPTVLVYSNGVLGWTHLALVYSNHVPLLFVNATLARTGLISSQIVHPSSGLGGVIDPPWDQFGPFAGAIQEVRIWDVPLEAPTIQSWMNQPVMPDHPAYSRLQGYWPLNEGRGTNAFDGSPRQNAGQLLKGTGWTGGRQSSARVFQTVLNGLSPGTTYHFRAVAINPGGTAFGTDQTFTTLPLPRVLDVALQTAPATAGSLLRFNGTPGYGYLMEASTNLVDWLALTNLVAGSDGLFEFLDISATNHPTRFYRLRVP